MYAQISVVQYIDIINIVKIFQHILLNFDISIIKTPTISAYIKH